MKGKMTMKFDFIYSDALSIIKQKKKDGMNFFSGDSLCLIVSENNKVYKAFNTSALKSGKLVSEPSEKIALKKMMDAGERKALAMIIMNCSDISPVLPDESFLELVFEADEKNKDTLVVTPDASYIKLSDTSVYIKDGDNSAIESTERIDIEKAREKTEEVNNFNFDFEAVPDEGEHHETVYLFAKPAENNVCNSESEQQVVDVNLNNQGSYSQEDISHMYMPINNQSPYGENMYRNDMNPQYMNQNGMNPQYMNQNGMNPQYMNQNGMNPQYMNQNGMNPQYMNQNGMNPQYMNQNGMNPQYMNQNGMNPQYMNQNGPLYMNQNGMSPLYVNQQSPYYMNQQYMNPNYYGQNWNIGVPQQASVYFNQMPENESHVPDSDKKEDEQ